MPVYDDPAKALSKLITEEIERETVRLAFRFTDLRARLRIYPVEPGVVEFGRIGDMQVWQASFFSVMRVLRTLPDRAGSEDAMKALEAAWEAGKIKPRPQDVPTHLQVGDTVGDGTVVGLTRGTSYENAKTGRDVRSIPRADVLAAPGNVIISLSSTHDGIGWWRRASQIEGAGLRSSRGSRDTIPHLRRLHAQCSRDLATFTSGIDRLGNTDRLLGYHRMKTSLGTLLCLAAHPQSDPLRAERIYLKRQRTDAISLMARLPGGSFAAERVERALRDDLAQIPVRRREIMSLLRVPAASPSP